MVLRSALAQGASALAALAATAAGQGGSLDGNEPPGGEPPAGERPATEGATVGLAEEADDDEEVGEESADNAEPGASAVPTKAPLVAEDLAAIAEGADGVLGPRLVNAISIARNLRPLQRSVVKNLEVETSPGTFEPLRPALGDSAGQLAEFRRLAGLLFVELSAVDPSLDPRKGQHDAPHLLAALRELLEMCAAAPAHKPPGSAGGAGAAPGLAAALASLGTSLGAALGSHMPKAAKEDKKEERVSVKYVMDLQEAYNTRPNGETRVELYEIANRSLIGHFREALKHGVFPVDALVAPDRMAPFASPTGAFSATDEPSMELNPKTGRVEDVSRDPKAAAATSSEEYVAKVRIYVTTIAVMLFGVKCDAEPYLVKGHESEDFCSLSVCNEFIKFTATQAKVPLAMLRSIMEVTLQEIAQAANARVGDRKSFTMAIREGLVQYKWRSEPVKIAQLVAAGGGAGSSPEQAVTPPAASKEAGALTGEAMAELIASGIAAGFAKINPRQRQGKGGGRSGEGRKEAASRRKRERDIEVEYDVGGSATKRKPKRGGWDDAPRCQQRNHKKDSWCAYSHAHM